MSRRLPNKPVDLTVRAPSLRSPARPAAEREPFGDSGRTPTLLCEGYLMVAHKRSPPRTRNQGSFHGPHAFVGVIPRRSARRASLRQAR